MESTEEFPILRISGQKKSKSVDSVVKELPLTIILNGEELVTLLCSPFDLKYLALGFLYSEGLLKEKEDLRQVVIDEVRGVARVETKTAKETKELFKRLITSGCGRGASFYSATDIQGQSKITSQLEVEAREVFELVSQFQQRSQLFRATGGVHSAALCSREKIIVFCEDIGRHNAIDKIVGRCFLEDIPLDERMMLTSGRISSEILLKVAKMGLPIIISRSAPTNLAVKLADSLGLTLIGFVRGRRMNIYSNDWRVKA